LDGGEYLSVVFTAEELFELELSTYIDIVTDITKGVA
jgi:hypothetical protein